MKIVKILLWLVLVLIVLAVGTVFVITNLVDPNEYKPKIEELIEQKTGRKLDLKGDLSLTWFPSIGVEMGPLSLSNAQGFSQEPMIAVNNAIVRVELLPLLKKQVEVDTVVLDSPQIRLTTNADGVTNWDDLIATSGAEPSKVDDGEEQAGVIAGLAVQGVSIKGGQVWWKNAQAQQDIHLTDLNLATGTLIPGEPLDIDLSVNASGSPIPEPAAIALNTTVIVSDGFETATFNETELSVAMQSLKGNVNSTQFNYNVKSGVATATDLVANLDRNGIQSTLKLQAMVFDKIAQSLDIPKIEINQESSKLNAAINATNILSTPVAQGSFDLVVGDLKSLLQRNDIQFETPKLKPESSLKNIEGRGKFSYGNDLLKLDDFGLDLEINELPTQLRVDALSFNHKDQSYSIPSLQLAQGDLQLKGGLNGVGVEEIDGQINASVADPVAFIARNGLDISLPEIPLSNIKLSSSFSLEESLVTIDGLTADFDHRQQPTQVNLPNGELNLQSGKIKVSSVSVEQGDASMSGSVSGVELFKGIEEMDVAGVLKIKTNDVVELLGRNQVPVELPEGLVKSINTNLEYRIANNNVSINKLNAAIDKTNVKGNLAINNLTKPGYEFNLTVDSLNVDALTQSKTPEEAQPSTAEQVLLPVAPLRGLNVEGKLVVGELITTGMTLNDMNLNVKSDENILRVAPFTAKSLGGTLEMQMLYDVSNDTPSLKAIVNVKKVDVGELLSALEVTQKIEGRGNLNTNLTGQGATFDQLMQSLNGGIDFHLIDGAIKGYALQATLLELEEKIANYKGKESSQKEKPNAKTRFAELSGSFQVDGGVFNNEDLTMKAPLFRVSGGGRMDLPKSRIDYKLDVNIVESVEGQGGADLGDLKGSWVPFKIYGPLDDLSYVLDVGKILEYRAKKEIKRKLLEELGSNAQQAEQSSGQTEPEEKDPVKTLGDEVGDKLKDSLLKGLGF